MDVLQSNHLNLFKHVKQIFDELYNGATDVAYTILH